MSTYDKLMACDGAQNCHPAIIANVPYVKEIDGETVTVTKSEVVGRFIDEDTLQLTDAGHALLKSLEKPTAKGKSGKKPVADGDIDLD